MDDLNSLLEGKNIIVKNNLIEDIVDSIDEFESSDVNSLMLSESAIVPGFIDAHNHLVWAGDRFNEHRLRMEGKSYADIANMGGGIMQTVHSTRNATDEELYAIGMQRLETSSAEWRHIS